MNRLQRLLAAIEIKGQKEEYDKAEQVLIQAENPIQSGNGIPPLVIGVVLISAACIMNPKLPQAAMQWIQQFQQQLNQEQQQPQAEQTDYYQSLPSVRTIGGMEQ